jgi:hypothetical protein
VFTVNESSTDYEVTFVEHFVINVLNVIVYTYRVTHNDQTFEVKLYPNGTDNMTFNGDVCGSIEMLTSQQQAVNLIVTFFTTPNNAIWTRRHARHFSGLRVNAKQTFSLQLFHPVLDEANKLLNDCGGIFTIKMIGSYLARSQHTVATSQAKFNPKTHNAVNTTYAWNMCNLTSLSDYGLVLTSDNVFVGFGVAEFYIILISDNEFLSIYSELITPTNIRLPLRVRHTFELVNGSSPEYAVVDKFSISAKYDYEHNRLGVTGHFNQIAFKQSMLLNCVTFKYSFAYDPQ